MGRFAEKMAYAGVAEMPVKDAAEPDPTPSMIAGGAAPVSTDMRAPPKNEVQQGVSH